MLRYAMPKNEARACNVSSARRFLASLIHHLENDMIFWVGYEIHYTRLSIPSGSELSFLLKFYGDERHIFGWWLIFLRAVAVLEDLNRNMLTYSLRKGKMLTLFFFVLQSASSSDGLLNILSGFDDRNCYGSILVWNNGSDIGTASINISGIPYDTFDIHVFRLDDDNMPGVSFTPFASNNSFISFTTSDSKRFGISVRVSSFHNCARLSHTRYN